MINSLHADSTYAFEIQGHADRRGKEKANQKLSYKRLNSVMFYFRSKELENVRILQRSYGEHKPTSKKLKYNRRVVIYTIPTNPDHTISFEGKGFFTTELKVPVHFFSSCGFCDSIPTVSHESIPHNGQSNVRFNTPCINDQECIAIEYRFPKNYFDKSEEVKVPKPLYVSYCGNRNDTLDLKEDLARFEILYDTLSDEYILRHPCFQTMPGGPCCGTRSVPCGGQFKLVTPTDLDSFKIFYTIKFPSDSISGKEIDSSYYLPEKDTFEFELCKTPFKLHGVGYSDSSVMFLESGFYDLPRKVFLTRIGFLDHTLVYLKKEHFKKLSFHETELLIKVPKPLHIDDVAFDINDVDFTVQLDRIKKAKFKGAIPNYGNRVAIKIKDEIHYYLLKDLKQKYKKKKDLIIVKFKKKDFINE